MAMQAVAAFYQSSGVLHTQFNCNNEAHCHGGHRGFKLCSLQGIRGRRRRRRTTRSLSVIRAAVSSGNEISTAAGTKIDRSDISKADVVVIGAGIGGLCCAALLARYGYKVVVCESHDIAGGAGHAFERQGFQFDSGPSFHAGLSIKPSINPLKQVPQIDWASFRFSNWDFLFRDSLVSNCNVLHCFWCYKIWSYLSR